MAYHLSRLFEKYDVADKDIKLKIVKEAILSIEEKKKKEESWKEKLKFVQFLFEEISISDKRISRYFKKQGIKTVRDLLLFLPQKYIDRRKFVSIFNARINEECVIRGRVASQGEIKTSGGKRLYQAIIKDKTGAMKLLWFNFNRNYPSSLLKKGEEVTVAGKVVFDHFSGAKSIIHPDILHDEDFSPGIIALYPSERFLSQKKIRETIGNLIEKINLKEYLPDSVTEKVDTPNFRDSLLNLHLPPSNLNFAQLKNGETPFHLRLKFAEFFPFQLALVYKREKNKHERGIQFKFTGHLKKRLLSSLPFELTAAQRRVIGEIEKDLSSHYPMNRLLQGDVGSGKTLVAAATALNVVEAGYQVTMMAPTEILAEQHYFNVKNFLDELDVGVTLLTGSITGRKRESILYAIMSGKAQIVIGTHALFQEDVKFHRLGYVIIDEQHRFGVIQRRELVKKGINPDVLVMTATPIPRTLAMTTYGDLDISILDEMPPDRKEITTVVVDESRREYIYHRINEVLSKGEQIYFVFPLIEKSEKMDLKNAVEGYEKLKDLFSNFRVSLLHGRMRPDEKEEIMRKFKNGEIDILVSTTVIEVGVDVPNATVMVIEHAERFGLAQLHQLRGRVGRGRKESFCFLVAGKEAGSVAFRRLRVLEKTTDGFKIAEEDLKIRGPGEILGTKQSGEQELSYSDIIKYRRLLEIARESAESIIKADPTLKFKENQAIRYEMLRLWGKRLDLGKIA